jgi:hypothetical protein
MMTLIQGGKPNYYEWSPFRAFSYREKMEVGWRQLDVRHKRCVMLLFVAVPIFLSHIDGEGGGSV